ncbi:MAG: hypothetical protein QM813_02230 [Verrucomicrobiota bacterium]
MITTPDWARVSGLNRDLFNACVRNARRSGDAGNFEELLQWCSVAAWAASGQGWFGLISSNELEAQLLRAARQLPAPTTPGKTPRPQPRWLHVFTEAYATLGHTNLGRRWIQYDSALTHDVMILAQKGDAPQNLEEAAKQTGGKCIVLDPAAPLLERAAQLRKYACENADVVLLHTHPDEVLGVAAFGVSGGPVVVVMNHADHVFWAGCAVADLILEIRLSGQIWTKQLRGVEGSVILPIPLVEPSVAAVPTSEATSERQKLRQSLGLPSDAVMLLTVGSASKYEAMPGLDFLATVQEILRACPKAYLVAVGPKDEGVWKTAKQATNGRILPLGYQPDSTLFCRSADLYLEGFPLGSLTALLEAGQAGLMCVRAPLESPVPFCSDSLSLDSIPQPKNLNDYVQTAIRLINDAPARSEGGARLQRDIESQHYGTGWRTQLQQIKARLPQSHQVRPGFQPVAASDLLRDWYLRYTYRNSPLPTPIEVATRIFVESWKRVDAQPRVDAQLWADLRAQDAGGTGGGHRLEEFRRWRFNRKLSSQGNRQRFLAQANVAFRSGKAGLARKLVYQCLLMSPSCVVKADWWKQFIKAHLGGQLTGKVRAYRQRRR